MPNATSSSRRSSKGPDAVALHLICKANLLPVECWDYGLLDTAHGIIAALGNGLPMHALHLNGIGDCIPVRSARCAIVLALKALGLPEGARIAAPLYCCPVVFKAIRAAGMRVRFIDVEPDGFCMSADDLQAKRHECDAVIAVHSFGQLCDMRALMSTGLPVIEDCAQAIGSSAHGTPAGRFGDVCGVQLPVGQVPVGRRRRRAARPRPCVACQAAVDGVEAARAEHRRRRRARGPDMAALDAAQPPAVGPGGRADVAGLRPLDRVLGADAHRDEPDFPRRPAHCPQPSDPAARGR